MSQAHTANPQGGNISTATPTPSHDPTVIVRVGARARRLYRVIIHDDPIHIHLEVALAVHRIVPEKSLAGGWAIVMLVDTKDQGVTVLWPKEHAEHYRKRFEQVYGLTSAIEAARSR